MDVDGRVDGWMNGCSVSVTINSFPSLASDVLAVCWHSSSVLVTRNAQQPERKTSIDLP